MDEHPSKIKNQFIIEVRQVTMSSDHAVAWPLLLWVINAKVCQG